MRLPALITVLLFFGLAISAGTAMAAGQTVSGYVTMADGSDPSAVTITLTGTSGGATLVKNPSSTGYYFFDGLSSDQYDVSASLAMYSSNRTYNDVAVSSASVSGLDFTMTPVPGTVTGFVSDGSVSITGALVGLKGADVNYTTYSTQPVGEFAIGNVAPGVYTPYAEKDGYVTSILAPIEVTSGSTVNLNFTLQSSLAEAANVTGVVSSDGALLSGVTVTLVSAEDTEVSTVTDSSGAYSFKNVPAGNYTLRFAKDGYVGISKPITVVAQQNRADDINLEQDSLPGTSGFLFDYDLPHSLMIVGLGLALTTLLAALVIRFRIGKKPELLSRESEEEERKQD